jgi:GntR family transcriptional regulator
VPQSLLPDPQQVTGSLYETLAKLGLRPQRALQHLRAVSCDAQSARLLKVARGAPGLLIERRAFLADGRAVEFTRSLYRGDAYDFVAELHNE